MQFYYLSFGSSVNKAPRSNTVVADGSNLRQSNFRAGHEIIISIFVGGGGGGVFEQ